MELKPRGERLQSLRKIVTTIEFENRWVRPSNSHSIGRYVYEMGISDVTARRDLDCLVTEGLLERRQGGAGWFRVYEYRQIPPDAAIAGA